MDIQQFDYTVHPEQALLWQYDNAEKLQYLINAKAVWYVLNYASFWASWYRDVFNLQTANGFGLAVWSIILNLPLFIELNPDPPDKPIFGFNEIDGSFPDYINSYLNFENGNFSSRNSVINLTEDEERLILRLRYFQLVSRGAIPEINRFLSIVFDGYTKIDPDQGIVYVLDNLNMTITYVFNFLVPEGFKYIFSYYGILPRPAGVQVLYDYPV